MIYGFSFLFQLEVSEASQVQASLCEIFDEMRGLRISIEETHHMMDTMDVAEKVFLM